jgi:hypothetical protein
MKSSMWRRSKRIGGVLAASIGMMAAVGVNPGVATADDLGAGQNLSLSAQCSKPQPGILATCEAVAPPVGEHGWSASPMEGAVTR